MKETGKYEERKRAYFTRIAIRGKVRSIDSAPLTWPERWQSGSASLGGMARRGHGWDDATTAEGAREREGCW